MEECLVVSLKLCGLGLRLYFLLMVLGSMECKTWWLQYLILVKSLSSASSTSSWTVLWCCSQRPERMPRWMTACSRFRSSAVARPHHELAAYTSFATTTDLKIIWTEAAVIPWDLSTRRAWTLCEHEEMTLLTCSRTERELVTVTPRIFMTSTRLMLARGGGCWIRGLRRLSVNTISWELALLRVKLLVSAHLSTLASSSNLLSTLTEGMMM